MKSLLFGLFLFMSFSISAQKLSKDSKNLETDHPEVFMSIKKYASSKWKNDSVKIIYEINDQAEAFREVCKLVIKDFSRSSLCLEAIKNRTKDRKNINFKDPSINWKEVLFDLRQRVDVKTAF